MKKLLVLGAGLAGTMAVNRLHRELDADWEITVVDQDDAHVYQPGLLFVPFGRYRAEQVVRPRQRFVPAGVRLVTGAVAELDLVAQSVVLADGRRLEYDRLIVATGTTPRPDQTPGMLGPAWRDRVHDFYTLEGAVALAAALERFEGGRLVVSVTELPFKCPVAPLEFALLADAWLRDRGLRGRSEVVLATPLSGAFTRPVASERLGHLLTDRGIGLETDFYTERVDSDRSTLVSYDEREIPYDLLVTVPVNMGAEFLGRAGLGDELNHVPVDRATFAAAGHPEVFVLGDAADLGTSKAGSTTHFSTEVFADNFVRGLRGEAPLQEFDGHANCFIESGDGRALLIDFDYDTEPLPGRYPLPRLGPFTLLGETAVNHWGKLAFRWVYWNLLLRGRHLPLPERPRRSVRAAA